MPVPSFQNVGENVTVEQLSDYIYGHIRRLNDFLANLDTLNVQELNAEVVIARSITGDKLAVNTITANEIKAGAVTAEKIDVDELSAITANMGVITAGKITTNAEINVGTDVTIGNNLNMGVSSFAGSKKITWSDLLAMLAELEVQSGDMSIRVAGFITLTMGSSMGLVLNKQIIAPTVKATTSMTLDDEPVATQLYVTTGLATKANSFSGYSGSVVATGGTLNFSNGILTSVT